LFENPGMNRGDVMAKFAQKWQASTRTMDRYYAEARKMAGLRALKASKARDEVVDQEVKKGALNGLKTRIEYFAELEKIAFGLSERRVGDEIIAPSDGDRVRALSVLIKGLGYDFKGEILKRYL
jgi:hypothetical protein